MATMKHTTTLEAVPMISDTQAMANEVALLIEQKIEAKIKKATELGVCPSCGSYKLKRSNVAGVVMCKECNSYSGKGYNRSFPAWARDRKVGRRTQRRHFRRAFCLIFGLTKEIRV